MTIGLVSDTHGYFDPLLADLLRGVDCILHAGDVGGQGILDELRLIAPVRAVRGNVDPPALGLPLALAVTPAGVQIEMQHILPAPRSQLEDWTHLNRRKGSEPSALARFLACFEPATRVVVFGHSHKPGVFVLRQRLYVNPGSAGKQRFSLPRTCGLMKVSQGAVEVKIMLLKDYNREVQQSVTLSLGGSLSC